MKYAVEVARLGSLGKASETLLIATPNISRSIKELEADLGITIFQRSAKGMVLTPDGEEFIDSARDVLSRIEKHKNMPGLNLSKEVLDGVKVLGQGELNKKLTVKVNKISKSAQAAIEAAGGSVEVI